jgi:hypothetical protein
LAVVSRRELSELGHAEGHELVDSLGYLVSLVNAGLLLPATLAQRLGLQQLLSEHVDLGDVPGAANVGSISFFGAK